MSILNNILSSSRMQSVRNEGNIEPVISAVQACGAKKEEDFGLMNERTFVVCSEATVCCESALLSRGNTQLVCRDTFTHGFFVPYATHSYERTMKIQSLMKSMLLQMKCWSVSDLVSVL